MFIIKGNTIVEGNASSSYFQSIEPNKNWDTCKFVTNRLITSWHSDKKQALRFYNKIEAQAIADFINTTLSSIEAEVLPIK